MTNCTCQNKFCLIHSPCYPIGYTEFKIRRLEKLLYRKKLLHESDRKYKEKIEKIQNKISNLQSKEL